MVDGVLISRNYGYIIQQILQDLLNNKEQIGLSRIIREKHRLLGITLVRLHLLVIQLEEYIIGGILSLLLEVRMKAECRNIMQLVILSQLLLVLEVEQQKLDSQQKRQRKDILEEKDFLGFQVEKILSQEIPDKLLLVELQQIMQKMQKY